MKNILLFGSEGLIGNNFYNFLKKKYNVICVDFKDTNKKKKIYNADVTDEKSLRNLFKKIELKYKRIHCVVNCAYPRNNNFSDDYKKLLSSDFNYNLSANVGSLFNIIKYSMKHFENKKDGKLINIGSIYGFFTPRYNIYDKKIKPPIPYSAIKAAQHMLIKHFASYCVHKKKNITFNTISPGGVSGNQSKKFKTKYKFFTKKYGMINKEDLNGVLDLLISNYGNKITGQEFVVDDGFIL